MKKLHFRFFTWLKLGLDGIFSKPLRLIALVFLSTFAISLFGLSLTMALYDEAKAKAESLYKYENSVAIEIDGAAEGYSEKIYSATGKKFTPLIYDEAIENWDCFYGSGASMDVDTDCLLSSPQKVILVDTTVFREAGISVIGDTPTKKDEVIICRCMANAIIKFGYYDNISSPKYYDYEAEKLVYDKAYETSYSSIKKFVGDKRKISLRDPSTGECFEATIVGVADYTCDNNHVSSASGTPDLYDAVYVSEEYMSLYGEQSLSYLVSGKADSAEQAAEILSFCKSDENLNAVAEAILTVEQYRDSISAFQRGFLWGSLGCAAFAAVLIYQFIALSVQQKLQEIGILRALGAKPADVFWIFFSESFILAFVYAVLATPVVALGSWALNEVLKNVFAIAVSVLNFHIAVPFAMLLLSVIITVVASLVPIMRAVRKSPAEYIRENQE